MNIKDGLYHKEIYWHSCFDNQAHNFLMGELALSRHLKDAIYNDVRANKRFSKGTILKSRKRLSNEIYKPFEVLVENGVVVKAVYRINHNKHNDICLVVRDGLIITAWLNSKCDEHKTLDKNKYIGGENMNKIKEVLALLDLEVNEEFKIDNSEGIYLVDKCGDVISNGWGFKEINLNELLSGLYEINKIPNFPKRQDIYFTVVHNGTICKDEWLGSHCDIYDFKLGNFYKTKEEITQEEIDKWVKFYSNPTKIEWKDK